MGKANGLARRQSCTMRYYALATIGEVSGEEARAVVHI